MTQWAPDWKVTIQGVEYTDVVLANLSISSGRDNIYTQAQAGYCTINIINLNLAAITTQINDAVSIQVKQGIPVVWAGDRVTAIAYAAAWLRATHKNLAE